MGSNNKLPPKTVNGKAKNTSSQTAPPRKITKQQIALAILGYFAKSEPVQELWRAAQVRTAEMINKQCTNAGQTTERFLKKQFDRRMGTATAATLQNPKFMPRAHGMSDSDAGAIGSVGVMGSQVVAGREIKRYVYGKKITAIYDKSMEAASKLYPTTEVITDILDEQWRGQLYYVSGFNCKGFVQPAESFPLLGTSPTANPAPQIARPTTAANDYSMFFNTSDYYNAMSQCTGTMPTGNAIDLDGGDGLRDAFYALKSIRLEVEMMNANSFYPVTVKVFVLRALTDLGSSRTPVNQYVGTEVPDYPKSQLGYRGKAPVAFAMYASNADLTNTGSGTATATLTYQNQMSVLPQVTPAMSQLFKREYEIVDVTRIKLDPLESLTYVLEKQIPKPTSLREIQYRRHYSHYVKSGDYGLMIEFQGADCIAVPDGCPSKTRDASTTIGEPVMGLAPSKLRVDTKKSIQVCAAAVDSTLNDIEALDSGQATWIYQTNFAPSIDTRVATFDYNNLVTTPALGKFVLPVYTDETKQYGGGIAQ